MVFLSLIFSVVFVVVSYTGLCGESTVCYSHKKKSLPKHFEIPKLIF